VSAMFNAPDVETGERRTSKTAPSHRKFCNGLSIEYKCKECKKMVIVRVGYSLCDKKYCKSGNNDRVIRVLEMQYDENVSCPNTKCNKMLFAAVIKRYVLSNCNVEYKGFSKSNMKIIEGKLKFTKKFTPNILKQVDPTDEWTYLKFVVTKL